MSSIAEGAGQRHDTALPMVRLQVRDAQGQPAWLAWADVSVDAALRRAAAQGATVLAIEISRSAAAPAPAPSPSPASGKFALLLFNQELLTLLEAGLHLGEALHALQAKARQPYARTVLDALLQALAEGSSFGQALAGWPQVFPPAYVATVRASERSGDLPRALARYVAYQTQLDALGKKLLASALYPAMLLLVGSAVSLFLLAWVIPRFAALYDASGQAMTGASGWLLRLGLLLHAHAGVALGVLLALVGALLLVARQPTWRAWMRQRVLALPLVRRQAAAMRLARLYRALALLLASGIALPRALEMVDSLLDGEGQVAVARCRLALAQGQTLSVALAGAGLCSPVAASLLQVGERSGQLTAMLEHSARFAEEEFGRWLDAATRLAEPVLMLCIGGVVGTLVVLMYLPVFELAGGLS